MIVLDTDHLSVLTIPRGQAGAALQTRLAATLLSANMSDFGKVPGLRVESWLS